MSVASQGMHAPTEHRYPAWQAFPQPPQLPWSLAVSTHTLSHETGCALGQLHAPATQLAPVAHAVPQLAQFRGSFCVSTHCAGSPQRVFAQSGLTGASVSPSSPASPFESPKSSRELPSAGPASRTGPAAAESAVASAPAPVCRSLNFQRSAHAVTPDTSITPNNAIRPDITTFQSRPDPRRHAQRLQRQSRRARWER